MYNVLSALISFDIKSCFRLSILLFSSVRRISVLFLRLRFATGSYEFTSVRGYVRTYVTQFS